MQRYGQIYVLYCVLQLWDPFAFLWRNLTWFSHKCVQADFLTNAIEQLPFPKTADGAVGQFTLVSRDPKHLFTFSDQYEWRTGEFLSYYLYN